jgi:hypothetical protein
VDRRFVSPELIMLGFIAARDYVTTSTNNKDREAAQWQYALSLADRAVLESDRVNPLDLAKYKVRYK